MASTRDPAGFGCAADAASPGTTAAARAALVAAAMGWLWFGAGCATPAQTAALAVAGATAVGAAMPTQELEQIYYLGVFDPEEQLPSMVYRLTVRGQASFLSGTRFASGWVPSALIDSLSGAVGFAEDDSGRITLGSTPTDAPVQLGTDRRFMLFGPEGFREAPRGHRLVIVMGADPKAFFEAIDGALAEIRGVASERGNVALEKQLAEALLTVRNSRDNLQRLRHEVNQDLPASASP